MEKFRHRGKSDFAHKTLFRFISHKILPRVKARIFYLYLKAYRTRVPPRPRSYLALYFIPGMDIFFARYYKFRPGVHLY